jgi:predicted deacylase
MQPLSQQEMLLVPLLLQQSWHPWRTWDLQASHPAGMPQVLLQLAATMALQLVLHCDAQSLQHIDVFLGSCPWEDMTSMAKTATAAATLRAATPEAIAVDDVIGCSKIAIGQDL